MRERVDLKGRLPLESVSTPETEKRNIYVQVMGVPASGKTTFVEIIEKRLGFTVLKEPDFAKSDLFKHYYDDPETYSFPFQLYVLSEVYHQQNGGEEFDGAKSKIIPGIKDLLKSGPIISEPPPLEHRLYAQARFGDDVSKWPKYEVFYEGLFERGNLPRPDIIAYLRVSFPKMLQRIEQRAEMDPTRVKERQEKPEYWQRLWDLHEEWVNNNWRNHRILTFNADIYDFNRFRSEDEGIESLVNEFLNLTRRVFIDPTTGESIMSNVIIPKPIVDHVSRSRIYDRYPEGGWRL